MYPTREKCGSLSFIFTHPLEDINSTATVYNLGYATADAIAREISDLTAHVFLFLFSQNTTTSKEVLLPLILILRTWYYLYMVPLRVDRLRCNCHSTLHFYFFDVGFELTPTVFVCDWSHAFFLSSCFVFPFNFALSV